MSNLNPKEENLDLKVIMDKVREKTQFFARRLKIEYPTLLPLFLEIVDDMIEGYKFIDRIIEERNKITESKLRELENRLFLIEERSRVLESEIEDTKIGRDRALFH